MKSLPIFFWLILVICFAQATAAENKIVDQETFDYAVQIACETLPEGVEPEMSGHSALLYLAQRGSKEVVPALIRHLEPIQKKTKKGKKKVALQCTWHHLRSALLAQTGKDFGFSQEKWQDWWDTAGKDLPEEYFANQVNLYQANRVARGINSPRSHNTTHTGP